MMKVIEIFTVLLLTGCGSSQATPLSTPVGPSAPPPVDSSLMQLRDSSVYKNVELKSVNSIDVSISATPKGEAAVSRHFESPKAQEILKIFKLNAPDQPGYPGSITTGEIVIHFSGANRKSKTLEIEDERIIEDGEFGDTLYYSSAYLNANWLKQL